MGRQAGNRRISGIPEYVPSYSAGPYIKWREESRSLSIDITVKKATELITINDIAIQFEPCLLYVRVHQVITTYYAGSCDNGNHYLVSIGKYAFDLMTDIAFVEPKSTVSPF